MKVAIPVQDDHVATVFDTADKILIFDGDAAAKNSLDLTSGNGSNLAKVSLLKGQAVEVLVCGALSGFMQRMIEGAGIQVFPFVRGAVEEVVHAFYSGAMDEQRFFLPGCCPRRLTVCRRRGRRETKKRNGMSKQ